MKEKGVLPILVLRFDTESAYALHPNEPENEQNWGEWISESLSAVKRITEILNEFKASATFFIVGKLLQKAGDQYAELLGANELIDVQSHTFTHCRIKPPYGGVTLEQLNEELDKTSHLLVKYFHKSPIGFCAPGNFVNGFQGCPDILKVLWEKGCRFVGSDGVSPRGCVFPAPFTQPYWYANDGYPDILELPVTGWHCNMLTNSGGQNGRWQPDIAYPDGGVLTKLPLTEVEAFAVRKREFEWAIQHKLIYSPAMHPWSIYRFGHKLEHLQMLIRFAREQNVPIMNAFQLYKYLKTRKENIKVE